MLLSTVWRGGSRKLFADEEAIETRVLHHRQHPYRKLGNCSLTKKRLRQIGVMDTDVQQPALGNCSLMKKRF